MGIMEMVGVVGMVGRCAMTYVIRYYVQCTSVRPSVHDAAVVLSSSGCY